MENNSMVKIGEVAAKFLDIIGDKEHKLADKVIEYNNTVILLLLVRVSETGVLRVLAVTFDGYDECLSDVSLIDYKNVAKVEEYVESRIPCFHYEADRIVSECSSDVEYALKNDVIYFSGEKEMERQKIADLNEYAVSKAAEIFKEAKKKGIKARKMVIDGKEFVTIDKNEADTLLGSNRHKVYSFLSKMDFIYSRRESGKTRFSYRERHLTENGKCESRECFAARAEKLGDLMKGGEALPA